MNPKITPHARLNDFIELVRDPNLQFCCRMLSREQEFLTWPAALRNHHNYEGGLLSHTVEVLENAHSVAEYPFPGFDGASPVDKDVLIAACIWHDYAKVLEYEIEDWSHTRRNEAVQNKEKFLVRNDDSTGLNVWVEADFLSKVGHVCGSAGFFMIHAFKHGVKHDTMLKVAHCILAHHGRADWGSPVEPQTIEAMILHHADNLSAKHGPTRKAP